MQENFKKKLLQFFIGVVYVILFFESFVFCKGQVVGLTHHPKVDEREASPIKWILQKRNGQRVDSPNPSLTFFESKIGVYGGCNSGSGKFSLGDTTLKISEMIVTEMACMGNGILEKESAYFQDLGQVNSYIWKENSLVLSGKDVKLEFQKEELEKDVSFTSTNWNLNAYSSLGMVASLVRDSQISLKFSNKEVKGFAGCSHFTAIFTILQKNKISIVDLQKKEGKCKDQAILIQEENFFTQILKVESYSIQGKNLTLVTKQDEKLYFRVE